MDYSNRYQPDTSFSVFPPAIKNLLIINGLFFVAQNTPFVGNFLMNFAALYPIGNGFWPWQLVTYMFLHGDLGHLFFNLLALWLFGQAIERSWGTGRFLFYYLFTGIGAGLIQILVSNSIVVGASGAVFGLLIAFGMMFPNQYIFLLFPPIPIKAKYFVLIYGGLELFTGLSGINNGIANFAHLGGMLFGYLLIRYWKQRGTFLG